MFDSVVAINMTCVFTQFAIALLSSSIRLLRSLYCSTANSFGAWSSKNDMFCVADSLFSFFFFFCRFFFSLSATMAFFSSFYSVESECRDSERERDVAQNQSKIFSPFWFLCVTFYRCHFQLCSGKSHLPTIWLHFKFDFVSYAVKRVIFVFSRIALVVASYLALNDGTWNSINFIIFCLLTMASNK